MEFQDPYDHEDPNLMYVSENIATQETEEEFNEQFTEGCNCEKNCTTQNACTCILKSGAYYRPLENPPENIHDNYVINITNVNKPIYECHTKCGCYGQACGNKLVQFGPRKHLKIISCESTNESTNEPNTKGLGLITTKNIKQGNFICEYAGEIISKSEATKRHKINEKHNFMNYIFCINEFSGENHLNTYIDPSKFGNIGRYLNHSCQPNCELIPIRIGNIIPKLCIFAAEDIESNCELTFDYGNNLNGSDETDADEKRIKCLCGSTLCKKYLPFSNYTI